MKTNNVYSFTKLLEFIVIAIVFLGAIAKSKAQNSSITNNTSNSGGTINIELIKTNPVFLTKPNTINADLNGLFHPTAAERFFKTGREDLAREIDLLKDSDIYLNEDVLNIEEEIKIREINYLRHSQPNNHLIRE